MYKIAICDDDKNYIESLKSLIQTTGVVDANLLQFYEFYSGEELLFYPDMDFDIVFMDMQMDKVDGYETAMELRKQDSKFLLIFCSGVVMPVPKFFRANVFRYLDKNSPEEECVRELCEIVKEMQMRNDSPFIMCKHSIGKERVRMYPEDVLYIAIHHTVCRVFPNDKVKELSREEYLRTSINLNAVADIFSETYGFVRIHNSYIVNMAYIKEISPTSIRLTDGTALSIARSKVKHFQEAFARYMASKYER